MEISELVKGWWWIGALTLVAIGGLRWLWGRHIRTVQTYYEMEKATFRRIFGLELPPYSAGEGSISRFQSDITGVLKDLARKLYEADLAERDIQAEHARHRKEFLLAKEAFWRAHNLAKMYGFEVHRKYPDYLRYEVGFW